MAGRTRLVLIRHGESRCMVDGVAGGHRGCTGLTELGRAQAGRLRQRLSVTGELGDVDVLIASTLARAVETASIIRPALGDLDIDERCEWCEHHIGDADGLADDEVRRRFGEPRWEDPDWRPAPGAETPAEFRQRVADTVARAADEHAGATVVAVCHGGVVNHTFRALVGTPPPSWLHVANTSITVWSRREGGPWELERLNDAAHLLPGVSWVDGASA